VSVRVSVAVAWPARQEVIDLELPDGSTVSDAIAALEARFPGAGLAQMRPGIWSRPCAANQHLRNGDRVELYRPLVADAKQMRRARVRAKRR
jgi:putative ubiquitin-RnfH superfamily antitoxin RatB of RatAB toxin-antitoxin module